MTTKWPLAVGSAIAAGGATLAVAALVLTVLDRASPPEGLVGLSSDWSLALRTGVQTVGLLTLSAVAGVVVWRQPANAFSRILAGTALLVALGVFADEYAVHGLVIDPASLPLADVAALSQKLLPGLVGLGALLALLTFPNGRLLSRRWLLLPAIAALFVAGDILSGLDDPYPIWVGLLGRQEVPVTVPPALWPIGAGLSWASSARALEGGLSVVVGASVLVRLARTHGEARQQLKWFAYAGTLYVVASAFGTAGDLGRLDWLPAALYQPLREFATSRTADAISGWGGLASVIAGMILVPTAIGIAMLRYRLYAIDAVISRTILYGGLAVLVTGTYALVVAGAGSLLGQRAGANVLLSVLAIAAIAALLEPVRSRLQQLANVAVYGKRARPYDVLSDFAATVGRAEPAGILLPRMATLLREGTAAAATEVWVKVGDRLQRAAAAPPTADTPPTVAGTAEITARLGARAIVEPVYLETEVLGALVVVKAQDETINAMERRLLHDLAAHAGLVFSRFRLVQELRESRSRIVAAQDAERRRIERNLHDGAQQRFVNALLALGLARAAGSPGQDGEELLAGAAREVQAGLGELRNLVRGLEPPLLSEAGLRAAVIELADRSPILTTVTGVPERRYEPGLEATAYYVVAEALTNAAKHSGAGRIRVCIEEQAGWLQVDVSDDGAGGADPALGSGIVGLHDRVAACGGRLSVTSPPGAGTTVSASLPCG